MSTLLEIIAEIKAQATAAGFKRVSEVQVVERDVSDTELPTMYIKLEDIDFAKFRINVAEETYTFELTMVAASAGTPISTLVTLQNGFLTKLVSSTVLKDYFLKEKVDLEKSTMTNDKEKNAKLGGESCVLTLTIENITNY